MLLLRYLLLRVAWCGSGVQGVHHPQPGIRYHHKTLQAYFPDTADGAGARIVLRMLEAYRRRLLFTIGQSATTGQYVHMHALLAPLLAPFDAACPLWKAVLGRYWVLP